MTLPAPTEEERNQAFFEREAKANPYAADKAKLLAQDIRKAIEDRSSKQVRPVDLQVCGPDAATSSGVSNIHGRIYSSWLKPVRARVALYTFGAVAAVFIMVSSYLTYARHLAYARRDLMNSQLQSSRATSSNRDPKFNEMYQSLVNKFLLERKEADAQNAKRIGELEQENRRLKSLLGQPE